MCGVYVVFSKRRRFVGDATELAGKSAGERELLEWISTRERKRWKIEKNLAFAESGSYWLAGEMGKCRNYLAAVNLSYYMCGLPSVYEDSPCNSPLDLTLTLHTVASHWF